MDDITDVLNVQIVAMPDDLKKEIRNQMIIMALGGALTAGLTIMSTIVTEKIKLKYKRKADEEDKLKKALAIQAE